MTEKPPSKRTVLAALVILAGSLSVGSVGLWTEPGRALPRADVTPVAPVVLSSALPDIFSNRTFAYTLVTTEPVNWTCVRCYDANLTGGPLSYNAGLHGTAPFNATSITYSVKASNANGTAYQNWTSRVLKTPVISSTPSFFFEQGVNYTYTPTVVNPGSNPTWTFTGAYWLTLNPSTGALYGPNPGVNTSTNILTYTSSTGSWTQVWDTALSTGNPFPATVSAHLSGPPYLNVTVPTTDVLQSGSGYVWLGQYPILGINTSFLGTYVYVFDGGYNYTLSAGIGSSSSNANLYFYWAPGSMPAIHINGQIEVPPAFPSSGFQNQTTRAAPIPKPNPQPSPNPGQNPPPPCLFGCVTPTTPVKAGPFSFSLPIWVWAAIFFVVLGTVVLAFAYKNRRKERWE